MAGLKFDLRKLTLKDGDLVLLVDNDPTTGKSPLLLVFYRFLDRISDSCKTGVTLLGNHTCHIDAKEAVYLTPPKPFCKYKFHFPRAESVEKSKIKYTPDDVCVGLPGIIADLKERKGYMAYAELLSAQSKLQL